MDQERFTGEIYGVHDGVELAGYIEVKSGGGMEGAIIPFWGRGLEGYKGQGLEKFGLIKGAPVSFGIDRESSIAVNIKLERRYHKLRLAFLILREAFPTISTLLVCICLILILKKLAVYLFAAWLSLWVIKICQDVYRDIRNIFD